MGALVTLSGCGRHTVAQPIKAVNVALIDITIPREYYNIKGATVNVKDAEGWKAIAFPAGFYESLSSVGMVLQKLLGEVFTVRVDEEKRIFVLRASSTRCKLVIPQYLANVLKLPTQIRGEVSSSSPVTLLTSCVYVMSDVIVQQTFNATTKPILRICDIRGSSLATRVYIPLTSRYVDTIGIWMLDDNFDYMIFLNGKPTFTLQFKCT
jgi:hypothetical protein